MANKGWSKLWTVNSPSKLEAMKAAPGFPCQLSWEVGVEVYRIKVKCSVPLPRTHMAGKLESHGLSETMQALRGSWVLGLPLCTLTRATVCAEHTWAGTKGIPSHPRPAPQPPPTLHLPFPPATLTTQKHSHSTLELLRNPILENNSSIIPVNLPRVPQGGWKV